MMDKEEYRRWQEHLTTLQEAADKTLMPKEEFMKTYILDAKQAFGNVEFSCIGDSNPCPNPAWALDIDEERCKEHSLKYLKDLEEDVVRIHQELQRRIGHMVIGEGR